MNFFLLENNQGIKEFFEGKDTYIPTSELNYLRKHPLVRPNFLTQIDDLLIGSISKLEKANYTGISFKKELEDIAIRIGTNVAADENTEGIEEQSKEILFALRDLRNLCLKINNLF
jgi:hypothetical protein